MRRVRAERNSRAKAREKNDAAEVIQKVWRGYVTRKVAGEQFCSSWMVMYGDVSSDPDAFLTAGEIAGEDGLDDGYNSCLSLNGEIV